MRESVDAGTAEQLNALSGGHFPGLIGFTVVEVHDDGLTARMPVRPDLLAPNGYLHAATVVGLADTACGYGCRLVLPEGATGFTTIELKSNFLGTVRDGAIACRARLVHGGRTTQVWDATVTAEETGRRWRFSAAPRRSSGRADPLGGRKRLGESTQSRRLTALRAPAPGARRGRGRPPRPRRVRRAARRSGRHGVLRVGHRRLVVRETHDL